MLLFVSSVSSHSHRDGGSQTKEVISFSAALRGLQGATQAKPWLEQELLLKWEGLSRNHKDQQTIITKEQEDYQAMMTKEQEDQWARMTRRIDNTFREVLSQVSQADSMRILPWFLSTAANPRTDQVHSVKEALTAVVLSRMDAPVDDTTPEFESSQAPAPRRSPVH